jgi:phosphoglycolate phosphatase
MTLIFDFDGTVAQTLLRIQALFNQVAEQYGLPQIADTDLEAIRELSVGELIARYKVSPWKMLRISHYVNTRLRSDMSRVAAVAGIKEVLRDLKSHGVELGVVTSNTRANVELFLEAQGITEFGFVHGEKSLFGKGTLLKSVIKKRKLNPADIFYVGDEVRDIEAARVAGIKSIAVTWGFNSPARLKKAQPDYLIGKPTELSQIVKNLKKNI